MKTTTETEILQQHPQANEPVGMRLGRGEIMEKEKAAELHTGCVRRPSYLGADTRPQGVTAATAQSRYLPPKATAGAAERRRNQKAAGPKTADG